MPPFPWRRSLNHSDLPPLTLDAAVQLRDVPVLEHVICAALVADSSALLAAGASQLPPPRQPSSHLEDVERAEKAT